MATVDMVWAQLVSQVTSAMNGTNPLLPGSSPVRPMPQIAIDWPPLKALQAVPTGALPTIISIFDRGATKNETHSIVLSPVLPPNLGNPGGSLTTTSTTLAPGDSLTITGSDVPIINDAFMLTLAADVSQQPQLFARYTVSNNTTNLTTALTNFTAQINLLSGITASLSGNDVTVTNNNSVGYTVWTEVNNVGSITQEGYRWLRDIQITVWSKSPAERSLYGNVLEQLLTQLEVNFGFLTADQSACRLLVKSDVVHIDTQLQDMYRRDWLICIDYPVLNTIPAWKVETIPLTTGPVVDS